MQNACGKLLLQPQREDGLRYDRVLSRPPTLTRGHVMTKVPIGLCFPQGCSNSSREQEYGNRTSNDAEGQSPISGASILLSWPQNLLIHIGPTVTDSAFADLLIQHDTRLHDLVAFSVVLRNDGPRGRRREPPLFSSGLLQFESGAGIRKSNQ